MSKRERLLFLRLRLVICKLSYWVLSSAGVVSNIYRELYRVNRKSRTGGGGGVNHASFEGTRASATSFSARGGEQSAVRLLHIYAHVSVACDFSFTLSLFSCSFLLFFSFFPSLFLFLFSPFSFFQEKLTKAKASRGEFEWNSQWRILLLQFSLVVSINLSYSRVLYDLGKLYKSLENFCF